MLVLCQCYAKDYSKDKWHVFIQLFFGSIVADRDGDDGDDGDADEGEDGDDGDEDHEALKCSRARPRAGAEVRGEPPSSARHLSFSFQFQILVTFDQIPDGDDVG